MNRYLFILIFAFGLVGHSFANPFDLLKEKANVIAQAVKNGNESDVIKEFHSEAYYNSIAEIHKVFQYLHQEVKDLPISSKEEMVIYDDITRFDSPFFEEDLLHLYVVSIPIDNGDEFTEMLFKVSFVESGEEDFKAVGYYLTWNTSFDKLAIQYVEEVKKGRTTFITQNFYSEEALAAIPDFEATILDIHSKIKHLEIGSPEDVLIQKAVSAVDRSIFGVDSLYIETYSVPLNESFPTSAPAKYVNVSFAYLEDGTDRLAGILLIKMNYPEDYARNITRYLMNGEGDSLVNYVSTPETFSEESKNAIVDFYRNVFVEYELSKTEELFFTRRLDKIEGVPDSIFYTIAHVPLVSKTPDAEEHQLNISIYFYEDLDYNDFRLGYLNVERPLPQQIELPILEQFNLKKEDFGLASFIYEDFSQTPSSSSENDIESNEFGDDMNSFINHINDAKIISSEVIFFGEMDRRFTDNEIITGMLMSNDESFIWILIRPFNSNYDDVGEFFLCFLKKEQSAYAVKYNVDIQNQEEFDNLLKKLAKQSQE